MIAKMQIYLSKFFRESLFYNRDSHIYNIDNALEYFFGFGYEKVFEVEFPYDPEKHDIFLNNAFMISQNNDGSNWNMIKACRSTSVGDIFVINIDKEKFIYIVASFGFDILKKIELE